jgi:FMN-dependent NADH-azoreductase
VNVAPPSQEPNELRDNVCWKARQIIAEIRPPLRSIQSLAARFQAADLIVLGVPMWNFAYPYKLKQLIDLVCQRNL